MNKENIITAMNVGSSRITVCIANIQYDGSIAVIGLGKADGKFMGNKGVLNIDVLSNAMQYALTTAEQEAGFEVAQAFVSISGANITSEKSKGMIRLGKRSEEIFNRHIRNVLRVAEAVPLGLEKEIIHSIPQSFVVDGQDGIKNPLGLYGVKMEVDALLVAADMPFLQNIIKCLNIAGVELEDAVFSGIATAACVFPKEEDPGCVILLEADNSFTSLSVFFNDVLRGIDVCGANILHTSAMESLVKSAGKICGPMPVSKIIITGSSFPSDDIIERLEAAFGVGAEIGYPRTIRGSARDINNPAYITAMGLAIYGAEKRLAEMPIAGPNGSIFNKAVNRLKTLFAEYF